MTQLHCLSYIVLVAMSQLQRLLQSLNYNVSVATLQLQCLSCNVSIKMVAYDVLITVSRWQCLNYNCATIIRVLRLIAITTLLYVYFYTY